MPGPLVEIGSVMVRECEVAICVGEGLTDGDGDGDGEGDGETAADGEGNFATGWTGVTGEMTDVVSVDARCESP